MSDDDWGSDLFDPVLPRAAAPAGGLSSELPLFEGLFDEPAVSASLVPPTRLDDDENNMEEDRASNSDAASDDNNSNPPEDEENNAEELEYSASTLAQVFQTTGAEFQFLFGSAPAESVEDPGPESAAATMQKVVALVTHETLMPQRSEWVGTILKEIVTLAGTSGAQPFDDLSVERTKALDAQLSQISQQIEKRKTGAGLEVLPELVNYETNTPDGIFARLPLQMSLKTLTILASTNEVLALELVNSVLTALQEVCIGGLVRNSSVVAELRVFLESIQAKSATGSLVWVQVVAALLHLAAATASLEHLLALAGMLYAVKTPSPVSLPVGALLEKLTVLANELHASFGKTMLAECWSNSNCSRAFETYNGTALSDRDQTFERNTNWERGMGCAFTNMPLPKAPVQYYEILAMALGGDGSASIDVCMGILQAPIPPAFVPLAGRPGQYVLWSSGQLQGPDGEKRKYCNPWQKNDVIGCGYDTVMRQIFFTQNGLYLGTAFANVDPVAWHCCLMITHRGVKIRTRLQLQHQFAAPGVGVQPQRTLRRTAVAVPEKTNTNVGLLDVATQIIDRLSLVSSAVHTGGYLRSTITEWPLLVSLLPSTFATLRALSRDDKILPQVLDILQVQLYFLGLSGRSTEKILPAADVKEWRTQLEDLVFNRNVSVDAALSCICNGFDIIFANEQATLLPRLLTTVANTADPSHASRMVFLASIIERSANHSAAAPLVNAAQTSPEGAASLLSIVRYLIDKTVQENVTEIEALVKGTALKPSKTSYATNTRLLIGIMHAATAKVSHTSTFYANFAALLLRSVPRYFDSVLAFYATTEKPPEALVKALYQVLNGSSPVSIIGQLCAYLSHHTVSAVLATAPEILEATYEALRTLDTYNSAVHKHNVPDCGFFSLQRELLVLPFNAIAATLARDGVSSPIDSLLFSAGFEGEWFEKDVPSVPVCSDAFLQEIIDQRGPGGDFEQKLRRFALLGSAGSQAMAKAVTHPAVDAACRALLAALLKHEDMVPAARFFLADESKSPPERRLQLAYKTAIRIKRALLMLHQTRAGPEKEYDVLAAAALSRAALVLALQRPQQTPGFAAKRSIRRSSQIRGEDTLSPVSELIADFVCGEMPATTVAQHLKRSRTRGLVRAVALAVVERALKELSAKACVLFIVRRHLGRALRTKDFQTHLPHYLDNLQGAGEDVCTKIRTAVYDVLGYILSESKPDAGLPGTLNSFAIKWATESDFQFLSSVGILPALSQVIHMTSAKVIAGRATRKLALRTLELLALSACRGAKKAEDGELGPAQQNFLLQLSNLLFVMLSEQEKADKDGAKTYAPLDGSPLLLNSVIFLDLLSGCPASRLVLNQPRWLPVLESIATRHVIAQQIGALRILRRVLPLSSTHVPVPAKASGAASGGFKSAISAAFSSAVPKSKDETAAAAPDAADNVPYGLAVCKSLLKLAGQYLVAPGTEAPWDQQGLADLAISALRAVLLTPAWTQPLLSYLCSLISEVKPSDINGPNINPQSAALAVLGGHLLRPRLGQRADTEKFSKGVVVCVKLTKGPNAFDLDIKQNLKDSVTVRLTTVDVQPDYDGTLADLHSAIAHCIPAHSASEVLTAIVKLLQGIEEQYKQSKHLGAHSLLKLQASQALHVLLHQSSTVDAFIGLGCSPTLLGLALDQWTSLEYPPALLVRFTTDLELRGIKVDGKFNSLATEVKPAAAKPVAATTPAAKPAATSAANSAAPVAHPSPSVATTTSAKPAAAVAAPPITKPAAAVTATKPAAAATPAATASAAAAATPAPVVTPVSPARKQLLESAEISVGSLFDDLDNVTTTPPRVESKPVVSVDEKDKKPEGEKKEKVEEKKEEVPLNWQVTFAKNRYFERPNNTTAKHDTPQPTSANLVKARDALAGYYARQAVIRILEAWLTTGRESPAAIASFVKPARLLDLFAAMFNVTTDPTTDKELTVLRNMCLHFLRSKVPLGGEKSLDELMFAAAKYYLQRQAAPAVHSNISRAAWLLDALLEAGESCGVWAKLHDLPFLQCVISAFAGAHGNDSMLLGTLLSKMLAHKSAWTSPPPVDVLRPLYNYVHTRYVKENNKSRKVYTRQLQRLSELLVPLITKATETSTRRETLNSEQPIWISTPSKRPVACSGSYSTLPGIGCAFFSQDNDGLLFEPKQTFLNRALTCRFRTPLAAVKGEFNTMLYSASMDRLVAARRGPKGHELGVWRNDPATWHGSNFMLDKLDDGWHFFAVAATKNKTCLWVDGHLVGTLPYAPALPLTSLGNALPSGGEQWGVIADMDMPAMEVKDPTLPATVRGSLDWWRAGPPRVSLAQLGSSDATVTDRVIASNTQFASFYGNVTIHDGSCCFSVELLSAGAIEVGFASADVLRSASNRAAFANDKASIMFESLTGVSWRLGDRETGSKKFKNGDVVTLVWTNKNGKTPTVALWHKSTCHSTWDWAGFNQTSAGVVPMIGLSPNQMVCVSFAATLPNCNALDLELAPPKVASIDNVATAFRDLALWHGAARAIIAGKTLPNEFVTQACNVLSVADAKPLTPLPVAHYVTLAEVLNSVSEGRNYLPAVVSARTTAAIGEHRHGLALSSLLPAELQLHYCVVRAFAMLSEAALPFIDFSLSAQPHTLAHLFGQVKQFVFAPVRTAYFNRVVGLLVSKSNTQKEIVLDRLRAAKVENDPTVGAEATFFGQGYTQLNPLPIVDLVGRNKQTWTCKFKGEGAIDHGGPYRESISRFCADMQSNYLGLFIKCPNAVHAIGVNREKWIPNPTATSRTQLDMLKFAGKLLGVAIFKGNMLGLDLPSIVWKFLVGEKLDRVDLETIDRFSVQSLKEMLSDNITADIFDSVFPGMVFTTQLSNGEVVELLPRGKDMPVTYENRNEYAALVLERRLNECQPQLEAMREGLGSMVNLDSLHVLTWEELECAVCGNEDFDVEALKRRTNIEMPAKSPQLEWLWRVLASFTPKQKACFLRFVWGQSRLPTSLKTEKMKIIVLSKTKPDEAFPESHTCFFELSIPLYSSEKILREKLLYAITNVTGIDGDGGDLMEDRNQPNNNNQPSLW